MSPIGRSEHERGPERHHLAVVAIRERDEALVRAGKADGEVESLRQQLQGAVEENARLRGALARIAAGHAHPSKLAGEALDAEPTTERGSDDRG